MITNPEPNTFELLEDFFLRNPTETLTSEDAAIKYGCHVDTARRAFRRLKERGMVTYATEPKPGIAPEYCRRRF